MTDLKSIVRKFQKTFALIQVRRNSYFLHPFRPTPHFPGASVSACVQLYKGGTQCVPGGETIVVVDRRLEQYGNMQIFIGSHPEDNPVRWFEGSNIADGCPGLKRIRIFSVNIAEQLHSFAFYN